jgi:hypothetical protein
LAATFEQLPPTNHRLAGEKEVKGVCAVQAAATPESSRSATDLEEFWMFANRLG